jgi:hypothetical protein
LPLTGGTLSGPGNLIIGGTTLFQGSPYINGQIIHLSGAVGSGTGNISGDANNILVQLPTGNGSLFLYNSAGQNMLTLGGATQSAIFGGAASFAGGLVGVTTNSNAAAGNVGEAIAAVASSSVTLPASTQTNVTSVSLTPGDWDVAGEMWTTVAGAVDIEVGISTVSATLPGAVAVGSSRIKITATSTNPILGIGPTRVSLASTTTVFLVGFSNVAGSATGKLEARRMR